jgi:hypothetical protein
MDYNILVGDFHITTEPIDVYTLRFYRGVLVFIMDKMRG